MMRDFKEKTGRDNKRQTEKKQREEKDKQKEKKVNSPL